MCVSWEVGEGEGRIYGIDGLDDDGNFIFLFIRMIEVLAYRKHDIQ